MSAEDRFDGTPVFPMRQTKLNESLQNLWAELEAGYILHQGKYQCGLCPSKYFYSPEEVKHKEGCVQPLLDEIAKASEGEVREFANAILRGIEIHRAWLIEAADKFIKGEPLPSPRSGKPIAP